MTLHQDDLRWLWTLCNEHQEWYANWKSLEREAEENRDEIEQFSKEDYDMQSEGMVTYKMYPGVSEKESHLKRGERIVKGLAKLLGLTGKVRRCTGGPAVMGEVAFVGSGVRIELTGLRIDPEGNDLMYRTETGDRFGDYGTNHWLNSRWVEAHMVDAAELMRRHLKL